MKVLRMNSRLDWFLSYQKVIKISVFTDVAIFDITLVTVAVVTGKNTDLTTVARSHRQY